MKRVKTKKQSKNDFISKKVAELMGEGRSQDQSLAIAFSLFEQKHQNGGFQANYQVPAQAVMPSLPPFQPVQQQGQQFQNYAQTLAQNNPIDFLDDYSQYNVDQNFRPSSVIAPQPQNPLAAETGSGYQTDDQGNPTSNEKFQFFNPYLGRDPQTSAYGLGESIQNKDALGIAGNAVHLLSSLGRNTFAGIGNAKREQYVMQDAMEKYREGLKPAPQSMQDGGYIKSGNTNINLNDVTAINKGAGTNFTPEFALSYFSTQTAPPQAPQRPIKYIQKVSTEGNRDNNRLAPGDYQKVYYTDPRNAKVENQDYEYLTDAGYDELKRMNNYRVYMEGLNKPKNTMVAEYQDGGMAGQMPPQEGQMQEDPQQLIMQVAEAIQGGADPNQILQQLVEMGIPQESAVQMVEMVMQQMQGQQEQQAPPEEFEMGGTKKKSLPKLLTGEYTAEKDDVEDEEVVAEVEKNEFIQRPDGEITQVLGSTHENGGVELTEEQLPENSRILSDHLKLPKELAKQLKDLGVSTKDTYAKALEKWTAKSGFKKIVEEQEELIKKLEAQSKLLVERPSSADTIKLNTTLLQEEIAELEKEKEPLDKEKSMMFEQLFSAQEASKPQEKEEIMENGGTFNNDIIVKYAKKHGISPERANELVNEYKCGGKVEYQNGDTVRYDDFYKQAVRLGYTGKNNQGDIQRFINKNNPQDVLDYFDPEKGNQPLTAKHIDLLKKNAPWTFKNSGIPTNKASADYTNEEKSKLKDSYAQGDGENGMLNEDYNNFILKGFADDKWDWRAPVIGMSALPTAGMVNTTVPQATATNPFLQRVQPTVQQPTEIAAQKEDKFSNLDNAQRARTGLMALPNQYAQLPDPLQGALKLEYRPNLIENQNITADPIIAEVRRSEQNAIQSIQNLPDEQRVAAMAQIQANTQEQLNKVMSQVQGQNLQSNAATANQNAQTLNQAQDINNRYLSDYENKIYKAQAITDADRRNYFLHNQKVNLENFNAINKANLYNQLADNYQLTDRGLELYNSPTLTYDGLSGEQYRQNVLKEAAKIKAEERKVAKKAVARNGGRFKKGN